MNPETKDSGSWAKAIVFFALAFITLVSYIVTFLYLNSQEQQNPPDVIEIPEPDIPPITSTGSASSVSSSFASSKVLNLQLNFIPTQNPFAANEYEKAPRIIYSGKFKSANIHIEGTVVGNEEVFLMFNFGQETGIINGVRTSKSRVNIQGTRSLGGIYPPASSISTDVNLLVDQLGASSSNVGNCNNGVCTFNFLGKTDIAQFAPVLVLPVTLNGSYGGAVINSASLSYECEESDTSCNVQLCEQNQPAYECISMEYGKEEADAWYERYLKNQK